MEETLARAWCFSEILVLFPLVLMRKHTFSIYLGKFKKKKKGDVHYFLTVFVFV